MTRLLQEAIERLRALPDAQQDSVAQFLLNELAEDDRWVRSTRDASVGLKGLIDSVLEDDEKGDCPPLDPELL